MKSWILPAIIALICWGSWAFLPKLSVQRLPPQHILVYEMLGGVFIAIIILTINSFRLQIEPAGIGYAMLTGIFGAGGALAYLYAMQSGKASVVISFTALYPVIGLILGWLILNEPITAKEGLGIFFALTAMLCFAL